MNSHARRQDWFAWWPVIIGLLTLYVPTFYGLANGIWETEDQAHGPMILLGASYIFWENRKAMLNASGSNPGWGWLTFVFGLLLYILGRSQDILVFEIGSLVPVVGGILLITRGKQALKAVWFALLFSLFMIPLPGFIVDGLTGPLKQYISHIAEAVLYQAGYPVARSGVTITIGQYQLLVADACSGLHSMFSLSALGLLYLYLKRHKNWLRNGIIVACILPMAFIANVIRVLLLILITYYFGDEAGQGFVHGLAGLVLFIVALLLIIGVDSFLQYVVRLRRTATITPHTLS